MYKNMYREKQHSRSRHTAGNRGRRKRFTYQPRKNSLMYKITKRIVEVKKKIKYRNVNHILEGVKIHQELEEKEKNL